MSARLELLEKLNEGSFDCQVSCGCDDTIDKAEELFEKAVREIAQKELDTYEVDGRHPNFVKAVREVIAAEQQERADKAAAAENMKKAAAAEFARKPLSTATKGEFWSALASDGFLGNTGPLNVSRDVQAAEPDELPYARAHFSRAWNLGMGETDYTVNDKEAQAAVVAAAREIGWVACAFGYTVQAIRP